MAGKKLSDATAFEDVVRHGAREWRRLDEDAADVRRRQIADKRAQRRAFNSPFRNGPVRTEVRVLPAVLDAAMKAAGGDASRLRIVSNTEVWVV